jgi:pyruvate kinase
LTPYPKVQAQLNLAAGVWPVLAADPKDTDDMVRLALAKVRETGLAAATERVVIAAGVPFAIRGTTNMIRVEQVL